MSIERINESNTIANKIKLLNNMILELNGKIGQAKFDKNELDNLYDQLDESGFNLDRKYLRNVSLGNTLPTYTDWSHVYSETGYSIWKIQPSNYTYNSLNELYFDNIILENRGEATSETATSFDEVFLYNSESGEGYTDNTTEAGTAEGTQFEVNDDTSDYLYVGSSSVFDGIKFRFHTPGGNYTLKVEYYDSGWIELTANDDDLEDDTNSFLSNGNITWTPPAGWESYTVNSEDLYWIRISTTTTPTSTAYAYQIVPTDSAVTLLALSNTQIQNEDWAWCSYDGYIYVTIRNAGKAAYEGNYFITSSSSSTNLQNYFIYNHEFKLDYEDSTYTGV